MAENKLDSAPADQTPLRVSSRLYQKKKANDCQESVAPPTSSGTDDDGVSPAAKKMRRYREKLKEQGCYEKYREQQREQSKKSKANRTEEKKQADREKSRLRVQKCRQKKIEAGQPLNAKPPKTTRASLEAKREKERERKRKYRAALTPQKRAAVNLKRRKETAQKRAEAAAAKEMPEPANNAESLQQSSPRASSNSLPKGFKTPNTKAKAVSRAKKTMPKSPSKYAEVAQSLVSVISPRKRQALDAKGLYSAEDQNRILARERYHQEKQKAFEETKSSRKKADLRTKADYCRFFLKCNRGMKLADFHKLLNVSWRYLKKALDQLDDDQPTKKKRSDAVTPELIQTIQDFLNRGDISREEPSARNVSAKDLKPRRYMSKTMKEAWLQFKEETARKISYSKFCCFRPKTTKTMAKDRFKTCCCEYCENITLKRKAINAVLQAAGHGKDKLLGSKYDLADMTCCAPDPALGLHSKACIDRECQKCGISKFHRLMEPMLNSLADTPATWSVWKYERSTFKNKQGVEVTSSRQALAKIDGPFHQLIAELKEDLQTFAWHLANYQWQQRQFDKLSRNVPVGWLVMCMDYGENFTCSYQDEAQGAHWTRQQITVHPVVCYYRCPDHPEVTTQETFCFISDDLKHDSHGVQHFQLEVQRSLLDRGLNFQKIIHFSDGCPSQYKGKTSFLDLSFAKEDTGIPTEKHFFGSRHGKGPCDREIGVVKRLARLAVLRRQCIIATAQDLYDYGCGHLTKPSDNSHSHTCRRFCFVREGAILRDRPERTEGKGIVGTRKLHCVRGHSHFMVSFRERSCFCQACVTQEGDCPNKGFVGSWKEASLKVNRRQGKKAPEVQPDNCGLAGVPVDSAESFADDNAEDPTIASAHPDDNGATGQVDKMPDDSNNRTPRVHDFVRARFTTGRKQTESLFYAKVLEVAETEEGSDLHLHYLVEKDGVFIWADKAWHPASQIKDIVPPPSLVPGRRLAFTFK